MDNKTRKKDVRLDVAMSYAGLGLVIGRARQIGLSGMSIVTGRVRLPLNAVVTVAFNLEEGGKLVAHRIRAMVVEQRDDGVELTFTEQQPATVSALRALLSGTPKGFLPTSNRAPGMDGPLVAGSA